MLNEMNFTNFADFIDQLNEVSDVTEWVRTNLDNIKLEKLDNNNPFPNFGGDAYGIGITIDDESTIPLRSTSINTLITRADVSGKGIQRVFDERKDLFCEHLNAYYALKPKKRKDCLALIQDGKLTAEVTPLSRLKGFLKPLRIILRTLSQNTRFGLPTGHGNILRLITLYKINTLRMYITNFRQSILKAVVK